MKEFTKMGEVVWNAEVVLSGAHDGNPYGVLHVEDVAPAGVASVTKTIALCTININHVPYKCGTQR